MNLIGTGYFDLTKIEVGSEAVSAKYVILNGEQLFVFNDTQYLSTPQPASITVEARTFNINTFKAEWQYYKNSREGWITIETSDTVGPFVVDPFSDIWQNKPNLAIRLLVNDSYYDEMSIAKIANGTDSITVILTNETQTVPSNSMGELLIPDLEKVTSDIQIFKGAEQLINSETQRFFTAEIRKSVGMTAKLTNYDNTITAVSLTDDVGEIEIYIKLVNQTLGGVLKKFTLVKAKYGEDGQSAAPSIEIIGEQIFKQINEAYTPSQIQLTAFKKNFVDTYIGAWYYFSEQESWETLESSVSENASFSIITIKPNELPFDITRIKFEAGGVFDETSIVKLSDGSGYTVVLSNDSVSVSATSDGVVSDLSALSTFVYAYMNTSRLLYTQGQPDEGSYSISVPFFEGGGATISQDGEVQIISIDKNYDTVSVPIEINLEGKNTLTKYMTISKSKTGTSDSQANILKSENIFNVELDSFNKEQYPYLGLVTAAKPNTQYAYISLNDLILEEDTYYTLHFSIKRTDGELINIGGDATQGLFNQVKYTIDDIVYLDFTKPPTLETLNDGALHKVVYTFKTSKIFYKTEYMTINPNKGLSTSVQFEIHYLKLEKGLSDSNWIPNFPDLGDSLEELVDTITIIEQKTSDSAIINTVTESTYFKDYMNSKADLSALKEYATNEELTNTEKLWLGNLESFYNDYLSSNERFESELEQTSKDITAKFSASGGVNLIKNSVGFAGTQHWELKPNTSISHIQNDELTNLGYGSGWYSPTGMNSTRAISQSFPLLEGNDYTLTVYINKRTDSGTAVVWLDDTSVGAVGAKTSGYEKFQYILRKPPTSKSTITVSISSDAEAIVTGLIVHLGDIPLQWTMAPGEIYNTNVQMDLNGIKVANIQYGKEKNYTVMTPTKFAGYYDVNQDGVIDETENSVDEVFRIDRDEFVMKNAIIRNELTMGPVKVIQINTEKNKGWAFLPNL